MSSASRAVLCVTGLGLLFASALFAGPLTPPPGAVTSTGKTLTEVEPRTALSLTNTPGDADSVYRISSPGSYYLTANMSVPAGKSGIEIAASNVTIDLSGCNISSVAALDAIRVTLDSRMNISIRNGTIGPVTGAGGIDIRPVGVSAITQGGLIENVHVSNTGGAGIHTGSNVVIKNCTATANAQNGFYVSGICTLSDCSASGNTASGFLAGGQCSFTNCSASGNVLNGFTGGYTNSLTNCVATGNTEDGIHVSGSSTVTGCTVNTNDGYGIHTATGGVCVVSGCSASSNGSTGIAAGIDSVVINCASNNNAENGINIYGGSSVIDCSVTANDADGISCRDNSIIRGNTCMQNGNSLSIAGAGIRAVSGNNRIEGNNCSNAEFGLYVSSAGNFIVRNTCAANTTNWVIAPDNIYGVIIDRRIPTTVASTPGVTGNAAAGTLGTTDPNANFSY